VSDLSNVNFATLTPAEFEQYLPELFSAGGGKVSEDPRLIAFLKANPDCAALVRDLETIAMTAKSLFEPFGDPSDSVWTGIQGRLGEEPETSEQKS
jgi:hypothetical protein